VTGNVDLLTACQAAYPGCKWMQYPGGSCSAHTGGGGAIFVRSVGAARYSATLDGGPYREGATVTEAVSACISGAVAEVHAEQRALGRRLAALRRMAARREPTS